MLMLTSGGAALAARGAMPPVVVGVFWIGLSLKAAPAPGAAATSVADAAAALAAEPAEAVRACAGMHFSVE